MKVAPIHILAGITLVLAAFGIWYLIQPNPTQNVIKDEQIPQEYCGDGICDQKELKKNECPLDCIPTNNLTNENETITYIYSNGNKIAVKLTFPEEPRYEEGAPVLVYVTTFFTPSNPDFSASIDTVSEYGFVHVAYLWPGISDPAEGVKSEGEYDYGGENSIEALRDVIKFASGEKTNIYGKYISELSPVSIIDGNVGLYAFSHPGIAATNVLAYYPELDVQYFVGRENPTTDVLYPLEPGHWDDNGKADYNPYYVYPDDYNSTDINIDYSSLKYDFELNLPYFDVDNDSIAKDGIDFIIGKQHPSMFGKDFYSRKLTWALWDNGVLNESNWPEDLATPQETDEYWPYRTTVDNYDKISNDVKVMLVFSVNDHVQTALDKPHIHQAYDGFMANGNWIRLNADSAYVSTIGQTTNAPDNDANTEPEDWMNVGEWAEPNSRVTTGMLIPTAAICEMADRSYTGNWSDNLDEVLVNEWVGIDT